MPIGLWDRFGHRVSRLVGSRAYARFVIVCGPRTGSNWLRSLLSSHPHILCWDELMRRVEDRDPVDELKRIYCRRPRYLDAVGFKLFYTHPLDRDGTEMWEWLSQDPDLRVIHLRRANLLRALVSRKIAETTGRWMVSEGTVPSSKRQVRLSSVELLERFQKRLRQEAEFTERFRHRQPLEVVYEKLQTDLENQLRRIVGYLQVRPTPEWSPTAHTKRQNPEPLDVLVQNYAELRDEFSGTNWERFFQPEE